MQKFLDVKVVITVALKKELPPNLNIPSFTLAAIQSGRLATLSSDDSIIVVITGVGRQHSLIAAQIISDYFYPLFVLNIGTCGGIGIKTNTWVDVKSVVANHSDPVNLDRHPPYSLPASISKGCLLTVDRPNASSSKLPKNTVDMEAYDQAKWFGKKNIPFFSLKYITDNCDDKSELDYHKNIHRYQNEIDVWITDFLSPESESISVVIPTFNRVGRCISAIESVLNQSLPAKTVIVVDDGSTDASENSIKTLFPKVHYIKLKQNSGVSVARNVGLKHCKTAWIAFLDSDDLWKKDKLKNQSNFLKQHPYFKILQSEDIWFRNGKQLNPKKVHHKPNGWCFDDCLQRCLISPSGVMIHRSLFDRLGDFDESLLACEDYDLWLRISRFYPVGLVPSIDIVKYGGHSDQLSSTTKVLDILRLKALTKLFLQETNTSFKKRIKDTINEKARIVMIGAKKRDEFSTISQVENYLALIT